MRLANSKVRSIDRLLSPYLEQQSLAVIFLDLDLYFVAFGLADDEPHGTSHLHVLKAAIAIRLECNFLLHLQVNTAEY